jgi:hypothetical protein
VADVIHLLAELIDNATSYSPAPSPVGVRAAMVAKGLAVEIEDRGLGLAEEDYAAFNAQLAVAPQFDVVALADDLRLGMFVIARLATRHGIAVTLRSSPYGGTTAIVLIPHDVVVRETPDSPATDGEVAVPAGVVAAKGSADDAVPERRPHERAEEAPPSARARTTGSAAPRSGPAQDAARRDGLAPLPRRVPQTSLATELREETAPSEADYADYKDATDLADFTAERAASSLAGFQRGTLRARDDEEMSCDHGGEEPSYDHGEDPAPTQPADRSWTPPADRS